MERSKPTKTLLHPDAAPVPEGFRPKHGVEYGCGQSICCDCYEPIEGTAGVPGTRRVTTSELNDGDVVFFGSTCDLKKFAAGDHVVGTVQSVKAVNKDITDVSFLGMGSVSLMSCDEVLIEDQGAESVHFKELDSIALPYEFDLLHDIKTLGQAYRVMKGEPDCSDATPEEVFELLVQFELPVPAWYTPPEEETPCAWLDGNGGYLTYEPEFSERHRYTPVYKKPQTSKARNAGVLSLRTEEGAATGTEPAVVMSPIERKLLSALSHLEDAVVEDAGFAMETVHNATITRICADEVCVHRLDDPLTLSIEQRGTTQRTEFSKKNKTTIYDIRKGRFQVLAIVERPQAKAKETES